MPIQFAMSQEFSPNTLPSSIFDWNDLDAFETEVGYRRNVADAPTATLERFECHITTLNPGLDSHPQHQHAQEEFIILKEGKLEVIINGVGQEVGPGSLFFYAANDYHSVRNIGDGPATYLVFNYATASTRAAPAQPAAESASPDSLRSSVYEWNAIAPYPTEIGERRDLFDSPTVTCKNLEFHITTINPGEMPHPPHAHPDEEIIIIKEGQLQVTVNGKSSVIGPGSIALIGSNDTHGFKNTGTEPATYFVGRIITEKTSEM